MWGLPKHKCEHKSDCSERVSDATAKWSKKKYGLVLCYDHTPRTIEEATKRYSHI